MAYERFVECRVEDPVPLCPYCDNSLDGPTVNGMHKRCHRLYNEELDLISHGYAGNNRVFRAFNECGQLCVVSRRVARKFLRRTNNG